jgi:hypothetical protein
MGEAEYAVGYEVAGHISMTEIKTNVTQPGTGNEKSDCTTA